MPLDPRFDTPVIRSAFKTETYFATFFKMVRAGLEDSDKTSNQVKELHAYLKAQGFEVEKTEVTYSNPTIIHRA